MLVQDRAVPKYQNRKNPRSELSPRFTGTTTVSPRLKSLDFSTWVSDNFYKIVTICILIFTAAAVFFLYNCTDAASFLGLQSKTQQSLDSICLPQINWNSIATIRDKSSPYSNFRSEQWIVVSVSDYRLIR
ncbi:hypothetical protein SLA2020_042200 [Shorea laevis]